jgi:hypothetical protein
MLSSERSWSRRGWRGHNSYHQKKKPKYFWRYRVCVILDYPI